MRYRTNGAPEDQDGRVEHGSLLIIVPVVRDLAGLERLLAHISEDVEENALIPFRKITSIHFARIAILPAAASPPTVDGLPDPTFRPIDPPLLFATDFDGTMSDHLEALLEVAAEGLERVFSYCEDPPVFTQLSREARSQAFHDFVARRAIPANAAFCGTLKRSVMQIRREARLREVIDNFLDEHLDKPGFPTRPLQIHKRVCERVFNDPEFQWLHAAQARLPRALPKFITRHWKKVLGGLIVGVALAAIPLLSLVIPRASLVVFSVLGAVGFALLFGWLYVRYLSASDPVIIRKDLQVRVPHLVRLEDQIVQNQLTAINYVKKPLWFRRTVLRLVLGLVNMAAKFIETQGSLAGIPSIHFARWVIIDEGRRLIFLSNFDGSWESYLGDFVDKAAEGLTGIWSNTVGFPKTKGLFGEGARDEQRFKAFGRDSQIPTNLWYSAYTWLTVSNINDNSRLREGLYRNMATEDEARAWLRMATAREVDKRPLPQAPKNVRKVDRDDVQGLVVRSYRNLHYAAYVPLAFSSSGGARAWLGELLPQLTLANKSSGEVRQDGRAINIAFTRSGLDRLGLTDVVGFSREFNEGLAGNEHRVRLLGDTGSSAPTNWMWGAPQHPEIHAMLFLFAIDRGGLETLIAAEHNRAAAHGVMLHAPLPTTWLGEKEHFGFNDGIAQPHIAGLDPDSADSSDPSAIPAGEVILGYRNAYGQIPISPTIPGNTASSTHRAPDAEDFPFGCNGSYVVFRQLEQDVQAFWKDLHERAGGDPHARKRLAAQMVGRWPNGAPLVEFPKEEPQTPPDEPNGFRYLGDLEGDKCPIGAHIRRTNPRDGLRPNTYESLQVSARHRVIRRGRTYGPPVSITFDPDEILQASENPRPARGLYFICFNTDISRQFEFVQSTWMNNPKFDGLYADPDPIVAPNGAQKRPKEKGCFTVQGEPVRRRYRNLKPFVRTVGGCYLFMPGFNALQYLVNGTARAGCGQGSTARPTHATGSTGNGAVSTGSATVSTGNRSTPD
jgi:Dyp-type peroxidase family